MKKIALILAVMLTLAACSPADKVTTGDESDNIGLDSGNIESPVNNDNTAADTDIVLSSDGSRVNTDGAEIDSSSEVELITITKSGVYTLTGSSDRTRILVRAPEAEDVELILSGVTLTSRTSAVILCESAKNLRLTMAAGSENYISDLSEATLTLTEAAGEERVCDSTVYSLCDVIIEGEGTLEIKSAKLCGITSRDDIKLKSGTLRVTAGDHGIKGRDSVVVEGGTLEVAANGDGVKSTKTDDPAKGFVEISGGVVTLTSGDDTISAVTSVFIKGGEITLDTGNNAVKSDGVIEVSGGNITIKTVDDDFKCDNVTGSDSAKVTVNGKEYKF